MASTTPTPTSPTYHNADSRPAQPLPIKGPANVSNSPVAPGSASPTGGEDLPLPHERDESATTAVATEPDPVMQQAKKDLDAGMVDTDMRATSGLDAARREDLVPGPGGTPPPSRGGV